MDEVLNIVGSVFLPHWPFWVVTGILALIGNFTAKHLFTRERAYASGPYKAFWWWGRESLSLHGILAGALLGLAWQDPEGQQWGKPIMSVMYFAASGMASLFAWTIIKAYAKKRGIDLVLPGDDNSQPPSVPASK